MNALNLNEYRCKCGKLLLKGMLFDGVAEIKCKSCSLINKLGNCKFIDDTENYFLMIDDKNVICNVSDSAYKVLGYNDGELIGKNLIEINPTLPNEILRKFFGSESVLNKDNHFHFDTFHQSKDKKNIGVRVLLKQYKPNNKEKFVLLSARVNNNQNDEAGLLEEYSKFIDNACDFYFDLDINGVIIYASPSMLKCTTCSENNILGSSYFDIVLPKYKNEFKKTFNYFCSKEMPFKRLCDSCFQLNKKITPSDLFFTPDFDDTGKFIGYRVLGWFKKKEKII